MKKQLIGYAVWLALAGLLYFFENNTGTRAALACSLLLPLVPPLRHSLLGEDEKPLRPQTRPANGRAPSPRQEEEPGGVRAYQPGDPVSRIHWKLSAKRATLLVRDRERGGTTAEAETQTGFREEPAPAPVPKRHVFFAGLSLTALCLGLLLALPTPRRGLLALLNGLFEASEQVNAYAYQRFSVPADTPTGLAALLLGGALLSYLAMTLLSGSRLAALFLLAGAVGFQAYFGLSLPAWGNGLLFTLCALWMLHRPWKKRAVLWLLGGIAAVTLTVALIFPGVDGPTEAASEAVRDRLSQLAQQAAGTFQELPAGENEARHAHTQSLTTGREEAQPGREYRLVTVEEQQISLPHWVDYLRMILLLLLTVAALILPFLPFYFLNRRQKKALEARKVFESENIHEAICALFQQVILWLEATGQGAGNLPYAQWESQVARQISPEYAQRFIQCERLFEEAAYSAHSLGEEQRQQVMGLLRETEETLWAKADWKQRLRLRYKEGLWL